MIFHTSTLDCKLVGWYCQYVIDNGHISVRKTGKQCLCHVIKEILLGTSPLWRLWFALRFSMGLIILRSKSTQKLLLNDSKYPSLPTLLYLDDMISRGLDSSLMLQPLFIYPVLIVNDVGSWMGSCPFPLIFSFILFPFFHSPTRSSYTWGCMECGKYSLLLRFSYGIKPILVKFQHFKS